MALKLTFGLITLNADFFLKQVLESIYPLAHKIIIADGAVTWWAKNGFPNGSADDTIKIIQEFPDPEKKILLVKGGPYIEKDDQCRAWFQHVPPDTDYVICNDADEVHSPENLEKLIRFLEKEQPTSVGFKSDSFFGGFERIIGGFERDHSFKRVLKYFQGCYYRTHRQPTLAFNTLKQGDILPPFQMQINGYDIEGKDITGNHLYEATGITMWHGSYVSPKGVFNKIRYYEGAVIEDGKCIPNYFKDVWLPWVISQTTKPQYLQWYDIEKKWKGVQEFVPEARPECFTEPFRGIHPPAIVKAMPELVQKFNEELKLFL